MLVFLWGPQLQPGPVHELEPPWSCIWGRIPRSSVGCSQGWSPAFQPASKLPAESNSINWSSREAQGRGTVGEGIRGTECRMFSCLVSGEQNRLQVIKAPHGQPLPLLLEAAAWHVPDSATGLVTEGK